MKSAGRLQAAIEVLGDIQERRIPAAQALSDWGRAHRFAGSGDRAAIGNLVFDALRRRASIAARMESDAPRALALGAMAFVWGEGAEAVDALCDGSRHAPAPLDKGERAGLGRALPDDAPAHVRGDYPAWAHDALARTFGERAGEEGAALAARAPVDLRVNTLKADRDRVAKALEKFSPAETPYSPHGLRVPLPLGPKRAPHLKADPAHGRGWFEIQDEGSQIAALLAGARPGSQVADLCAGAGGKTLALATAMANSGQIYAWDADPQRLRPIFERLRRAGTRNVQTLPPGEREALAPLAERMDVVMIDAPCSGAGVWRRRPDAKWRLAPAMIEKRREEQRAALDLGAPLVKPGGRLVYITCSVFQEENIDQVAAFTERWPDFMVFPYAPVWRERLGGEPPASADGRADTLQLSPAHHGADGFFVAILERGA